MISVYPSLGCDPEFFFVGKVSGVIRGAEKVIPEKGMEYHKKKGSTKRDGDDTATSKERPTEIVRDGVQAELHPRPNTCRANLANEISCCLKQLYEDLIVGGKYDVSFQPVVKITKRELDSLSDASKVFGCAESFNAHKNGNPGVITVDPTVYRYRSAGGHIHLGSRELYPCLKKDYNLMANVLDILVGNTCVLIDRDPLAVERRKVYGKAGEYRKPPYGIEYRTLSNFWLRNYVLMSLVFGLSRMAVSIVHAKRHEKLLSMFDMSKIEAAINNNDAELAMENFLILARYMKEDDKFGEYTHYPCTCNQIPYMHIPTILFFIERGVDYWFTAEPLKHWVTLPEAHEHGWESFLSGQVSKEFMELTADERKRFWRGLE